jgi:hypothetical protein
MIGRIGQRGQTLLLVMIVTSIALTVLVGFAGWATMTIRAAQHTEDRELAFLLAEAGTEYYRWHLAHAATDYQDGTGAAGPYVHTYEDKDGDVLGTFSLSITAPPLGSTVVTVKSTGVPAGHSNIKRAVEVQFAKPSWAKYAIVANDVMRFGTGTEVYGQIHSNGGIRFDGLAHNTVTSAVTSYDDPDHTGSNEYGVHTHLTTTDPLPPTAVPSRTDVFEVGREFPVPAVDFTGITADLSQMKTDAQSNGRYFAASGNLGYRIVLNTNDTFTVYRVTSTTAAPSNCTNVNSETDWGTWSVQNQTLVGTYANPTNGIIFVEDHLWVEGQINTARLTIAAGRFPENSATYRHITVNNDLRYTNYDGQDTIALIAQGNFNVGMVSADTLRIDAAIISQHGRAGRYYYRPPGSGQNRCSPYHNRTTLTLYGMIGTYSRYGFAWTDGTGYATRNLNYDGELLYSPPPSFPLTSDDYETISWREVAP